MRSGWVQYTSGARTSDLALFVRRLGSWCPKSVRHQGHDYASTTSRGHCYERMMGGEVRKGSDESYGVVSPTKGKVACECEYEKFTFKPNIKTVYIIEGEKCTYSKHGKVRMACRKHLLLRRFLGGSKYP